MTADSRGVAIRGVGVIGPDAIGVDSLGDLLRRGESTARVVERFDTSELSSHHAALVRDFKPREFIAPMRMRRMNALSRMAVAATKLALDDAKFDPRAGDARTGVALGSAFGPVSTSIDYLLEYVEQGPSLAPPQLFAESVANAPGSHMAIECGLTGFNVTFTQRSSSAAHAIAFAALELVKGTAFHAIAGGVDEVHEITFAVLDRLGALAHAEEDVGEAMRPFDRRRNGISLGEGAAMFVLDAAGGSEAPWGFVSGIGFAKDPTASVSDWGEGDTFVERALRAALDDAGINAADVGAIWASANGSVRGDRLEARALRRIWSPDEMPPVVATKGLFGEYAAAGAMHLASALVALRNQALPRSPGYEEAETGVELPVSTEWRSSAFEHVLLSSVSEGGGVVAIVLSRGEH